MARNNAFNFNRLSRYNYDFLSLEEVIFLEYLIFHEVRKIDIPVQTSRIEQETGLKKHRQQRALDLLTEKGYIQVEQLQHRKKVILNGNVIVSASSKIYLKSNKSIERFLGQLITPLTPIKKEKEKPLAKPIPKQEKPVKSASGKATLPLNQISLFD